MIGGKEGVAVMSNKALVVIDIQNDITKHYRNIIDNINAAIDWAADLGMTVIYIKHNNLSPGTRTFKPDTKGAEPAPELKVVSDNIFVKTKANALTSRDFSEYIRENGINEFYITGADATACVKSTCFNMTKDGYAVHVISVRRRRISPARHRNKAVLAASGGLPRTENHAQFFSIRTAFLQGTWL